MTAGVVAAVWGFSSCTGDLDLMPTDPRSITAGEFAKDPKLYMEQVMSDVYLNFCSVGANGNSVIEGFDGGMSSFSRTCLQLECFASDEMAWLPTGADWGNFRYGQVASNAAAILGMYSRLTVNITLCNDFIRTVNDGYFSLPDNLVADAEEFVRQAKILRSAAYFYLMDNFGNVPYADETLAVGSVAPQMGQAEIYNNVTATLEEVVDYYKKNDPNNCPPYGYVGLDVAEALLVKYYLNAKVYTGTPAWDKCADHAEAIIARLGHDGFQNSGLAYKYWQLFGYNNNIYTIGGSSKVNEIIWVQPSDAEKLQGWTGGSFLVNAWAGEEGAEAGKWNASNGWKCLAARGTFVTTYFDWDENYYSSPDQRTWLWSTAKEGFPVHNPTLAGQAKNGFITVKYSNWAYNDDQDGERAAVQPAATDILGMDYAAIRLAEIYLSAAEAYLQSGTNNEKALKYVNYIRERAGLDPYTNVGMSELKRERAAELYNEACRRTDLIRWDMWLSNYNWSWKNGVAEGADYNSAMRFFPLPISIVAQAGYTQNPGY